jgi:hypothetical protein
MDDPLWTHDCSSCVYLGKFQLYDLYFCNQMGNWPTVIARYGNNGWDYFSGLNFSRPYKSIDGMQEPVEPLRVARERAEKRGLCGGGSY